MSNFWSLKLRQVARGGRSQQQSVERLGAEQRIPYEGSAPFARLRPQFNIFQLAWEIILVRCIVYYRTLKLYYHYYFRLKPKRDTVVLFLTFV